MNLKSMTESRNNRLIVIAGPTGVGKTSYAIQAAKHFNTEIISCDSRQLFKELSIGVGRPSENELAEVKHHFIASHSIHEDYNAGKYAEEANALLVELFKKYSIVIMTGGTGLYIKAATIGFDSLPEKNEKLRKELKILFDERGIEGLQQRVKDLGLDLSNKESSNPQRLIRAIEIEQSDKTEAKTIERDYTTDYYFINRPREELYDRINRRVDEMMTEGHLEEVRGLTEYEELNALQTVGYKEFFSYLKNKMSLDEAIAKMKQHSRNYAKRQLTWFSNQGFKEIGPDYSVMDL